jgi:hypothetical protein
MANLFFRSLSQGLQAFMPVAAALVWTAAVGAARPRSAIRCGLLLSIPATVPLAWWFQRSAARALDEAILATVAFAIALVCARGLRSSSAEATGGRSPLTRDVRFPALAAATMLIVVRQTMEIGSVFDVAALQLRSFEATSAIVAGTALAAAAAWLWTLLVRPLPPPLAEVATMTFATLFLAQVAVYAFHEWSEARLLPWSEALHAATEPYGPDGIYGIHFSDLLIVGPLGAVGWTLVRPRVAAALGARFGDRVARPRLATVTISVVCVASMGMQRADAPPPAAPVGASPAEIAPVLARPHLVFRDTAPGPNFGRLSVAPLDNVHRRLATAVTCQRVSFAGGRGLCLHVDRGVFNRYTALLLDRQLHAGASIKLQGLPSRTRAAADGQVGAVTVFVTGDDYAAEFSTRTTIVDLSSGDEIGELEQFATWQNGVRFRAVDFNFWGVTFARDTNTFYASLRSAGTTYLVRGELGLRKLTVLRTGVECPSLSPDGRLLAYKKRVGPSPDSWRLHVLELATNVERIVDGETRYIDDQVEWLDRQRLLYAIPRRTTSISDVWVVPVDGGGPARIFLEEAESPIVVH